MKHTPVWKNFLAASIAAFGLTTVPAVLAEPGGDGERCHAAGDDGPRHGSHRRPGDHDQPFAMTKEFLPPFLDGLKLDDQQRDRLFKLHHDRAPREHELRKQLRQAREALHEAGQSENFDPVATRKLAEQHAKAISELVFSHAELAARARSLLTPEQRKTLDARLSERRRVDH